MKQIIALLLLVVLVGMSTYFYINQGGPTGALANSAVAAGAPVSRPEVRLSNDIFGIGIVVPVRSASLSMGSSGTIEEILVREGELVEAGQPLLRLSGGQEAVAVAQAEANLRAAQARLAKVEAGPPAEAITVAEVAVEIAQANLNKLVAEAQDRTLVNSAVGSSITIAEAELRSAQAELDLLQSGARAEDIETAQAEVTIAEADLEAKELEAAAQELRAPFAGTIASIEFEVGEFVAPDDIVLTLADLNAWQIESHQLDEITIVNVEVGDEVRIAFDAIPDLELTGKLARIKPVGNYNEGNVTYTIVVVPDQRDPRVRWNMTAQLTIKT